VASAAEVVLGGEVEELGDTVELAGEFGEIDEERRGGQGLHHRERKLDGGEHVA
jgi:hypothetical protein